MGTVFLSFLLFVAVVIIFTGIFTVKQQSAVVIERFGKFNSIRHAGLQFKIPVVDKPVSYTHLTLPTKA